MHISQPNTNTQSWALSCMLFKWCKILWWHVFFSSDVTGFVISVWESFLPLIPGRGEHQVIGCRHGSRRSHFDLDTDDFPLSCVWLVWSWHELRQVSLKIYWKGQQWAKSDPHLGCRFIFSPALISEKEKIKNSHFQFTSCTQLGLYWFLLRRVRMNFNTMNDQ